MPPQRQKPLHILYGWAVFNVATEALCPHFHEQVHPQHLEDMQGLANLGCLFAILEVGQICDANSHPVSEFQLGVAKLPPSCSDE